MKERPILFSGPMVRAILDGRKMQTRRVIAFKSFNRSDTPGYDWHFRGTLRGSPKSSLWQDLHHGQLLELCPFGLVGNRLWVRERHWFREIDGITAYEDSSLRLHPSSMMGSKYIAASEPPKDDWPSNASQLGFVCRPSIFMPRWASRITLAIKAVRVERLNDISETDAVAEGIEQAGIWYRDYSPEAGAIHHQTAMSSYCTLWDSINGKRPGCDWGSNPWVWVITFERLKS